MPVALLLQAFYLGSFCVNLRLEEHFFIMRENLESIFICPKCNFSLELKVFKKTRGRIHGGELRCKKCKKVFKIIDDIVCFKKLTRTVKDKQKIQKAKRFYLGKELRKEWLKHFTKPELVMMRDQWQWMIEKTNLKGSQVHLDFCTGAGRFLGNIPDLVGGEIVTLDFGFADCVGLRELLKKLRKYSRVTIVCADAHKMPFAPSSISSITSWHGLDEPGTDKAVKESKRVLKRDGRIAASGLFYEEGSKSLKSALKWKIKFAKEGEVLKYFKKANFKDIQYRTFFKTKSLERKDFLPKFGDYYTIYGISGRK
ncbi:class I SAM-dependent methyltransferase [Patescibacteria group bacterium]|nr:MAG: class I SAM-dependent methyltransferase [Patescibacteria group bacterium]